MSYISVAEEEGGEPIELPAEDDGRLKLEQPEENRLTYSLLI